MTTWAFRIDTATNETVHEGMLVAKRYDKRIPTPIRRTIGLIHGLPNLHHRATLHEIEVYLGRAGDSAQSVRGRWKAHRERLGHKYAAVLFRCVPERAVQLERMAIKVLKQLETRGKLCVGSANIARGGNGRSVRHADFSTIYMTWRVLNKENDFIRPSIHDIREIAEAIARPDGGFYSHRIVQGLKVIKSLGYTEPLKWYPD